MAESPKTNFPFSAPKTPAGDPKKAVLSPPGGGGMSPSTPPPRVAPPTAPMTPSASDAAPGFSAGGYPYGAPPPAPVQPQAGYLQTPQTPPPTGFGSPSPYGAPPPPTAYSPAYSSAAPSFPGAPPPGGYPAPAGSPGAPGEGSSVRILDEQTHFGPPPARTNIRTVAIAGGAFLTVFLLLVVTLVMKRGDSGAKKAAGPPQTQAGIAVGMMDQAQQFQKAVATWNQMKQIWMALQIHQGQGDGEMPADLEELFRAQGIPGALLKDAWGAWLDYDPSGPTLSSSGADGQLDTEDDLVLNEESMGRLPPYMEKLQQEMMQNARALAPTR